MGGQIDRSPRRRCAAVIKCRRTMRAKGEGKGEGARRETPKKGRKKRSNAGCEMGRNGMTTITGKHAGRKTEQDLTQGEAASLSQDYVVLFCPSCDSQPEQELATVVLPAWQNPEHDLQDLVTDRQPHSVRYLFRQRRWALCPFVNVTKATSCNPFATSPHLTTYTTMDMERSCVSHSG